MPRLIRPVNLDEWNELGRDYLPGHLGIEILSVDAKELRAQMKIRKSLRAPNGFPHAASVVGLADTACGYATVHNLPHGAEGFTTIEIKTNFIGTTLEGSVSCVAKLAHKGRTTQVWDAVVRADDIGKTIALFRCSQLILWPKVA